jgi:hypothetical protein
MHLARVAQHSHDDLRHVIDTGTSRLHLAG